MSWSTSELRVRLAPLNWFKPSSKIFYWPFQGGTSFVDLLCFCSVLCLLCLCARLFICNNNNNNNNIQVWYLIVSIPDLCTITYFYFYFYDLSNHTICSQLLVFYIKLTLDDKAWAKVKYSNYFMCCHMCSVHMNRTYLKKLCAVVQNKKNTLANVYNYFFETQRIR